MIEGTKNFGKASGVRNDPRPKSGVELIADERQRQIEKEGWTADHDDEHGKGEMAIAAACYALPERLREVTVGRWFKVNLINLLWPWTPTWWKPSPNDGDVRDLVKAGALIAAEIDRIQRRERQS